VDTPNKVGFTSKSPRWGYYCSTGCIVKSLLTFHEWEPLVVWRPTKKWARKAAFKTYNSISNPGDTVVWDPPE
jgi:hypothetical protein